MVIRKSGARVAGENVNPGEMTPPRSLGRLRSCRETAAGVAVQINAESYQQKPGITLCEMLHRAEKKARSSPEGCFTQGFALLTSFTEIER